MNTLVKTSFIVLSIVLGIAGKATAKNTSSRIYVIPQDARCVIRKENRTTYCTDKNGTPITGELRKYHDNVMLRQYPLQNGLLHGTAITYDTRGRKKTEKEYANGVLEGSSREYTTSGILESEIQYTAGKKHGIAKYYDDNGHLFAQAEYVNNRLNGNMRLYDEDGQVLYNMKNSNNKYTSGTYYYQSKDGHTKQAEIPAVIISAINHKCLNLHKQKTTSACAATFDSKENKDCDQDWRKQNRPAVRRYLASCAKGNTNE